MVVVWGVALAVAADLEVGTGAPYATIDDALDVAVSGDTIVLRQGTYAGTHHLDDSPFVLTFQPAPGAAVTLRSTSDDGFFHIDGSAVTVRDVAIDGDGARAARVSSGSLTLERVTVSGAGVDDRGGAVLLESLGALYVVGGVFEDNTTTNDGNGGAIRVDAGGDATIAGTRFEANVASGAGGAIDCRGTCSITDARFVDNAAAGQGGAVFVDSGAGLELDRTWFCANRSEEQGGALAIDGLGAPSSFGHLVFFGNEAVQQGGAVWNNAAFTLYNSDFVANAANQQGAAMYANADLTAYNLILTDHTAGEPILFGAGLDATDNTEARNTIDLVGGNASAPQTQSEDPQYVFLDLSDCESSDLHLRSGSLALGVGNPTYGSDHGAFGEQCSPVAEVPGDGIDQDCNGVDSCFLDGDGDGVAGPTVVDGVGLVCAAPYFPVSGDCDDADPERYPGQAEVPLDSVDQDCDGAELCFLDADEDGYGFGDPDVPSTDWSCDVAGVAGNDEDCDDTEATVSPGAPEQCENGVDDDCDGVTDTDAEVVTWFRDADDDGHGTTADTAEGCRPDAGYVALADDCNDGDGTVYPDAAEVCDGIDQDCDDLIDEGLPDEPAYADADGDGFGDPLGANEGCRPPGYVADASDCDDTDDRVYPGALELCNGVDDDCDGALSSCDLDSRGGQVDGPVGDPIAGCGCDGAARGSITVWGAVVLLLGVGVRRRMR